VPSSRDFSRYWTRGRKVCGTTLRGGVSGATDDAFGVDVDFAAEVVEVLDAGLCAAGALAGGALAGFGSGAVPDIEIGTCDKPLEGIAGVVETLTPPLRPFVVSPNTQRSGSPIAEPLIA